MPTKKRDYKDEYEKFHKSPAAKKKRAECNKNRRKAVRDGRAKKGDGKDVAHTKNGLRMKPASQNRGSKSDQPGDKRARGKGQKKNQPKRKKK